MSVRKLKPITPGQRFRVVNEFAAVDKNAKPEKTLVEGKSKSGGRNNTGKMTMRYIGGGHKQKYRIIDFKRDKEGAATVESVQYDPNRTAFIALLSYEDGEKRYIIAQNGLKAGQVIVSGENVEPEVGNAMKLKNMPLGTVISCIELRPGQGAVMARSAGTYAQLVARDGKYAIVKLPSGESRMILV